MAHVHVTTVRSLKGGGRTPASGRRRGPARLVVGYLAIAAVMPYMLLKLAWISGSTAGILEESPLHPAVVRNGNVTTVVMELIAIAIILAFTHSWGLELPAWLVLIPAWIGIGLLAPFVITGPAVAGSVLTGLAPAGDGSLAPWVGPLVYLGFGAQAVGIAATFVLYVRARWTEVIAVRLSERPANSSQPALTVIGWGVAVLLAPVVVIRLLWSLGSTWGLADGRGVPERLAEGASAFFAAAAIAGVLMLILRRPGRLRAWTPVVLAWIGGGATLASAAYSSVLLVIQLSAPAAVLPPTGIVPAVDLLQLVAGTAIGVAGAVLLTELADGPTE